MLTNHVKIHQKQTDFETRSLKKNHHKENMTDTVLKLEKIRDRGGEFTGWLSGRRFAFTDLPKTPLEKIMDVGP